MVTWQQSTHTRHRICQTSAKYLNFQHFPFPGYSVLTWQQSTHSVPKNYAENHYHLKGRGHPLLECVFNEFESIATLTTLKTLNPPNCSEAFNMDIQATIREMDTKIADVLEDIASKGTSKGFTRPRISTMTITFELSKKAIRIDEVEELCAEHIRSSNTPRAYHKKRIYRRFRNAVTVIFRAKTIKVFTNGKLHVTGCRTVGEAELCVRDFMKKMKWTGAEDSEETETEDAKDAEDGEDDAEDAEDSPVKINNVTMHTFNTCIRADNCRVSLENVQNQLDMRDDLFTSYNPDVYHGLKVKKNMIGDGGVMHTATALVFYTGSMMFTGARSPKDVDIMFDIMANVITPNNAR